MIQRELAAAAKSPRRQHARLFDRLRRFTGRSAYSLPGRRRLTLRCLRARCTPLSGLPAPLSWTPTIPRCGAARSAPTETRLRRWRIWAVAGHSLGACPSGHTRPGHEHSFSPMVVPTHKNRERQQNKRGNQAASPPTILFQYLLLKTVETRFEALLRCFLLISGASCFLRHERLPLFFYSVEHKRTITQPASLQRIRGRALIMLHQKQRRSAAADVTCGEGIARGGRTLPPAARPARPESRRRPRPC